MHSLEPAHLAAGAGEDRAALSGHPRKADAGQYESVLHQGQYANVMQHRRQYASMMQLRPRLTAHTWPAPLHAGAA